MTEMAAAVPQSPQVAAGQSPAVQGRTGEVLPPRRSRAKFILPVVLLAIIGGGGWYGFGWYTTGRFIVSTDDAYVRADMAIIAAKVPGYIASVAVSDNMDVKQGDLLARIDDGDYRLAVEAARRKVDTQDATLARIDEQVKAQASLVDQARAQATAARADSQRALAEFDRATKLLQGSVGTQQRLDLATADRDRTAAAITNAEAAVAGAQSTLLVLAAQKNEAARVKAELQTALDKAQRDLSFTEVRAPFAGVIGNRAAQPGQYVQPGSRLMALVPLSSVYLEANFKETQFTRMKPGQRVTFSVDAVPDREFEGTVDSFAPASGAQFSLLPPENATGNFTKIVQRFPVRVKVPSDVAKAGLLRPGQSVTVNVHTRGGDEPPPSLIGAVGLGR